MPAALRLSRPATFLCCVSDAQRRTLPRWAAPAEVENGVPVSSLRFRTKKAGYCLVLARLCPEKAVHEAIDAADEAGVPLVVAGDVSSWPAHRAYVETRILPRLRGRHRFGVVRDAIPALAARGAALVHVLRIGGRAAAAALLLRDAWSAYYYIGGSIRRSPASPGTLVGAHAIDRARADGLAEIDLLRGAEPYKYRFGAVERVSHARVVVPGDARPSVASASRATAHQRADVQPNPSRSWLTGPSCGGRVKSYAGRAADRLGGDAVERSERVVLRGECLEHPAPPRARIVVEPPVERTEAERSRGTDRPRTRRRAG